MKNIFQFFFIFRYRPVIPINDSPNLTSSDKFVLNTQNDAIFSFQVQRQRTGANIWDTSIGGLLFSDRFLQIATLLPSDKIYGFGENVHQEIKVRVKKINEKWVREKMKKYPKIFNFSLKSPNFS